MQTWTKQNTYNYNPNFQAVLRAKINPRISDNVRDIVDRAEALYESVKGKQACINGVTINNSFINEPIMLSKKFGKVNATIQIDKCGDDTQLSLLLQKPKCNYSTLLQYNSLGISGYPFTESLNTYLRKSDVWWIDSKHEGLKGFKTYAQRNAAIEKYAGAILDSAEQMKKIFIG